MKTGWSAKLKCSFLVLSIGVLIGATSERTAYTNTSNKDLKPRILRLVKDVRELVYAYKKQDSELMAAFDKKDRADAIQNDRRGVKEEWLKQSDKAHDSFMRQYKEKYWADAILFKNELYRRLPKKLQQPQLAGLYQYPTNLLGVEAIADNLELLAKSLPDS